jgi:hypothetical protein
MSTANEFQPRVTCLPFEPNDSIVLSVSCDNPTNAEATGCDIAVLLAGTLTPVNDA